MVIVCKLLLCDASKFYHWSK